MAAGCPTLSADIFRAYDIRGIAGQDLTADNTRLIGRAIGELALSSGRHRLLFGRDGRLSSPALGEALQDGIRDAGVTVMDLGRVPTPLVYFATHTTQDDSGVILTASHNPADYNGIKIVIGRRSLTPGQITGLYERSRALLLSAGRETPVPTRGGRHCLDIAPDYRRDIGTRLSLARPLHVVVDCGNAVAGEVAPGLFEALGCRVERLFCDVDGHFPNHHPDPTINSNLTVLRSRVIECGADLGVALDGDGDRVVMVSESGRIVDTDRLLMLLVRDILPRHPGANVVFDVKCSSLLRQVIQEAGGHPVLCRSGHSFMKVCMAESRAVLGAEFSAHVFIAENWFGHDDGLFVAARFMELLGRDGRTVDELLDSLPASVSTGELRMAVDEQDKFPLMARIADHADFPEATINHLDGVRAEFENGWGLIRASNTTPALLLRFEADSRSALHQIQGRFRELLQRTDRGLRVPF